MSTEITGKIAKKGLGAGTWALETVKGETYELRNAPDELQQEGMEVKVIGQIREDVMTFAMIGPVLEVSSFQKV